MFNVGNYGGTHETHTGASFSAFSLGGFFFHLAHHILWLRSEKERSICNLCRKEREGEGEGGL